MTRLNWLVACGIAFVYAGVGAAPVHGETWSITLDATRHIGSTPYEVDLPAGTFTVKPVGGGWSAWLANVGCDGGGEKCERGFESEYEYSTELGNRVYVWNKVRYATPEQALLHGFSSVFSLLVPTRMKFFLNDCPGCGSDNRGYLSLEITNISPTVIFTLGKKDNSDAEFAQAGYASLFEPQSQPVSLLAKEINLTWFPTLYLRFNLTQSAVDRGITMHLDPAWNDGTGALRVAVECWTGNAWREAGSTLLNMVDAGYVDVPSPFLRAGRNDIRLRAINGTGGTTIVTWDQIAAELASVAPVWQIGRNDGSADEFAQTDYSLVHNPQAQTAAHFPKEINTGWYRAQYLRFELSEQQAQRAANLELDPFWTDGAGELAVGLERWDNGWVSLGAASINQTKPGVIVIPAYQLHEGLNEWRLFAVTGTGGTSTVVWDKVGMVQRAAPARAVTGLLGDILDTSLNYFLSPAAIPTSGLPVTALKIGDRARYGYSNPTEWGYAIQAWIVAAERGRITSEDARARIERALMTMLKLQADPGQFAFGMFYPFYIVVDASGNDIAVPYHSGYHELPSGDCALLWGSLNVAEGWLRAQAFASTADRAAEVKGHLSFRDAYFTNNGGHYLSMLVNADTHQLSPYTWLIWPDEGGVVSMVSMLSGSLSFTEFQNVLNSQWRMRRSWNGHVVAESAWFNAMFTWAQRAILGFPMFGDPTERAYGVYSFLPNIDAHLAFGELIGIDYPAFSDAMTQTDLGQPMVGRYVPPNIPEVVTNSPLVPRHITPHALAVPLAALDALDDRVLRRLFEAWLLLRADTSGIWHPAFSQDPLGFEVLGSPYLNVANYSGADEGRFVFETLSESYTVLSLFEGLQGGAGRGFGYFAKQVPGFSSDTSRMLAAAYSQH